MIEYNDTIQKQLIDNVISIPTVLMCKDEIPYEYKTKGSINRLKRRRQINDLPYELFSFLVSNNITKNQLREFASGLFLNYIEMSNIYN